ncbi:MAG: twin-arginine translocase TatA/TatE family subunit [Deltaproteobacteria bacterium]|nr:twin-arginine translocase TatA/TatE family subunit [Deltaproteobacteria bacterium]
MFGIGATELIIILVIILIIFGVGKLPSIGAGLGQAIKNFKKASSENEIDANHLTEKPEQISSQCEKSVKAGK